MILSGDRVRLSPDEKVKCLFIQPKFVMASFWNYVDTATLVEAKTPQPPLGLITAAAILPQHWEFRLLDLNTREFCENDWAWADLICVGGMLPQQNGILEVIKRANRDGKFVAVGGADASSQPELYEEADARVLGEGEITIPMWLKAWREGNPRGLFTSEEKPDITKTPTPRFDLLRFRDYVQVGVQYSRGCPFNCEFCDIIELFGRVPRTKSPEQIVKELETLYQLGYRGQVDLVDDNFIGNKRNAKRMLPTVIEWQKKRKFPFFFATEASMNLADDQKLMALMRDAEFRFVFMGIETPDPETLIHTQKSQNTMKPIADRVHAIYKYGMIVTAGFILGFDTEKPGSDKTLIQCIEDSGINMAMVGLLIALPNTQLTRRLHKEGRVIAPGIGVVAANDPNYKLRLPVRADVGDQTTAGLNFVTIRDREDIFREYVSVLRNVYAPANYFARALRTSKVLQQTHQHKPGPAELWKHIKSFVRLSIRLSKDPTTRRLYWLTLWKGLSLKREQFEALMINIAMYLHFYKHSQYVVNLFENRQGITANRDLPRNLEELRQSQPAPALIPRSLTPATA